MPSRSLFGILWPRPSHHEQTKLDSNVCQQKEIRKRRRALLAFYYDGTQDLLRIECERSAPHRMIHFDRSLWNNRLYVSQRPSPTTPHSALQMMLFVKTRQFFLSSLLFATYVLFVYCQWPMVAEAGVTGKLEATLHGLFFSSGVILSLLHI